jgi:hypothetical protein
MSEAIKPTAIEIEEELATLKKAHADLLVARRKDKSRITELESTVNEFQTKLSEANDSIRDLTVNLPLKAMAESISPSSELWLERFNKSHRLEMVKGQLTVLDADGKPVLKGDKPVPFERQALVDLLTNEAHPQSKAFRVITFVSKATGANGQSNNRTSESKLSAIPQFGLR